MSVEETVGAAGSGQGDGETPEVAATATATGGRAADAGAEGRTGEGADGGADANGRGGRGKAKKKRPFWQELPILIVIALLLSLGIKTFFVQAFSIPSGSMQHTLEKDDRVLVDKFTPWFGAEPERGEVVVFKDPGGWLDSVPRVKGNAFVEGIRTALGTVGLLPSDNEKDLIKRVIAVGGDTVECREGSPVKVNGVALDEPYLYPGATPCGDAPVGTVTVPKDQLWVMGDHRNDSRDSRFHVNEPGGGFVPVKNVIGRAFVIAWPLSRWDTLSVPDTFDQKGLAAGAPDGLGGRGGEGPAEPSAPEAALVAAAVPFVLLRRRRVERAETGKRTRRAERTERAGDADR
ncbi:signal peptidase I [Streptomyces sp. TLI_053]|uniref:signal peptidase I n=1 Tax=Streptomyces sp. TLI_053 TaxID=1855352 RepID=UPI00087BB935|nr:signal peptidase I [Streptomyces sp. TLI_053]SDS94974.1 signal peptidase I [Streptomyces sp. TLI_053]